MAFLNFMKKGEELPSDIDLDVPPEPPGMLKEEISAEGPIDEELMPLKKGKPAKKKERKIKDFLGLPSKEADGLPEIPPLPKIEEDLELPPPPAPIEVKKELFSFFKPKKAAEKLPLPKIEDEIPELPPLPESKEEEFPEIPPLPGKGEEFPELPPLPKENVPVAPPLEISAPLPEIGPEPLKPVPKQEVKVERPIKEKKFVTINDFKQIQGDISSMKGILKGTDGFFIKLEEVKGIGDKGYKELYNSLQDIQKKIMFVDKTLFKEQNV